MYNTRLGPYDYKRSSKTSSSVVFFFTKAGEELFFVLVNIIQRPTVITSQKHNTRLSKRHSAIQMCIASIRMYTRQRYAEGRNKADGAERHHPELSETLHPKEIAKTLETITRSSHAIQNQTLSRKFLGTCSGQTSASRAALPVQRSASDALTNLVFL
jgi:hypothetical protein